MLVLLIMLIPTISAFACFEVGPVMLQDGIVTRRGGRDVSLVSGVHFIINKGIGSIGARKGMSAGGRKGCAICCICNGRGMGTRIRIGSAGTPRLGVGSDCAARLPGSVGPRSFMRSMGSTSSIALRFIKRSS